MKGRPHSRVNIGPFPCPSLSLAPSLGGVTSNERHLVKPLPGDYWTGQASPSKAVVIETVSTEENPQKSRHDLVYIDV